MIERSSWVEQQVRIKRVHPEAIIPSYQTTGAAGFDLAAVEDIGFQDMGEIKLAPTGLVIETPKHHMLYITFRSSTPRKWGITVLEGIVDEDYCGEEDELKLQVMNLNFDGMSFGVKRIPAGTRIAQGVMIPITRPIFQEVDYMGESRGGWGSTG